MIKRLSNTITKTKELLFRHAVPRIVCYLAIAAALLLFWLFSGETEVSFVYNAF